MPIQAIKEFLRYESASGILLLVATILAMLVVNSPVSHLYDALLDLHVEIRVGNFQIAKPLLLWINDGLMAIFFFLIGLEVKREVLDGELSEPSRVALPVIAAIGGMALPAIIYSAINWGDPVTMRGWAIPSATDIAFSLGVLALLGSRIPSSLKLFLMALAIVDDLGAIIIIAIFYTSDLSVTSLAVAAGALLVLFVLNRKGVLDFAPYLLVGTVLWAAVLKSGVHATLAGVLIAMFIPFRKQPGENKTQLETLEHDLHPVVAYGILPLFAFANTGISFAGITTDSFTHSVPLGIAAGLFIGNQVGVLGFSWIAIKSGLGRMPSGASWLHMYGVALLCGIGFTMSLFISSLAFQQGEQMVPVDDRLGILIGSFLSGLLGYVVLRMASGKTSGNE
jgi:NhaA family Na+:H+ antiporter